MNGKSQKPRIKKLQINLTNRWLYTLIAFFSLIIIGVFVYATAPNPGHDITEMAPPAVCTDNQFLKWDGSAWACGDAGGSDLWTQSGSDIYYDTGNVGINTTSPLAALDIPASLSTPALSLGSGGDSGRIWTGYINSGPAIIMYDLDDVGGGIYFRESPTTGDEASPEYEAFIIGKRGSIGIGVLDPTIYKLSLSGSLYSSGPLRTPQYGIFSEGIVLGPNTKTCSSDFVGMMRYRAGCSGPYCDSYLEICMQYSPVLYNWYTVQSHSWDDCPEGEQYYECDYVDSGCYAEEPEDCYEEPGNGET